MNQSAKTIPTPALLLGLGGLIPFVLSAVLAIYPQLFEPFGFNFLNSGELDQQTDEMSLSVVKAFALNLLTTYAAVILSFLGGIRWGQTLNQHDALTRWSPLSFSVLPSLVGWMGLLLPVNASIILLTTGFVVQYLYDRTSVKHGGLPFWFGRLRTILTTGAVLSLVMGLAGSLLFTQT